jgi:PAS domain S-box-containing protein
MHQLKTSTVSKSAFSHFLTRRTKGLLPQHVVAAGVVIFAAFIVGSLVISYLLRQDALRAGEKESANLATLLAEHAVIGVESTDHVLSDMAGELGDGKSSIQIGRNLALHDYLVNHLHGMRYVRSFIVNDSKGQLAGSTLVYPPPEQYSGDLGFFRVHEKSSSSDLFIDHPIKGRTSNAWLIRASRRITGPAGDFVGVVTAGMDIDYFQSFYGSLKLDSGSTLTLLHTDGTVLAVFPKNDSLLAQPAPRARLGGIGNAPAVTDEMAIVTVKRLEKYPLAIAVSMSETSVYGSWWTRSNFLFAGALFIGSIAMLTMLWFAKHLRREMELGQSLHLAEENYQALTNQPLAGVAKVDATSGKYLAVNDRLCAITGYSSQELLTKTLYDVTHPDDKESTKQYLNGLKDDPVNSPLTFNKRYVHKDGSTVHTVISTHRVVNSKTGAVERIGLVQDVTASVVQDRLLKEHENRLSVIIHNSMDAIITIDQDQNILIFNTAAELMFGYLAQDALHMPLSKLIPQAHRDAHHAHVQAYARSGGTARKMGSMMVLKGLRFSGEEFPLDASISRATIEGKVYMTVILRDLTEQVKAQNELNRARKELRELSIASQTAREEEKSRISRELHDELGQNLTALKMDLSWLQAHTSNDLAARNERIRAMQSVLDSTVVATRRIAADLRPLMLDDLGLKAALEWLTQDFSRRTQVRCQLVVDEDVIDTDTSVQSALYRAVQECLTNVSRHAQATQVTIEVRTGVSSVNLQVQDNGIGISDQARNKRGSFGLIGMRERIYILGGKVLIESLPDEGTHITIDLPRHPNALEIPSTN